ncbi:MAG TPA: SgcJ/EcaC family oxidoreductase [Solirubrobacteraceae bacterium]|nr:SgcJ/EcaC family oxidoreductase [Solirubrobacteraceae bacterium]
MRNAAVNTHPRTVARSLMQHLQDAWNAADGAAFGAPFASDADFVTIRGELHSGAAIAAGHQQIFDTIYAGSTLRYTLVDARELDDRVILAHVRGRLSVPAGPLAGESESLASIVVVRDGDDHRIAAFHNTLVAGR